MNAPIRISESESEVMKLLWEQEPLTAGEIIVRLQREMDWSDQTIKTFLNRLLNKEAIRFEKSGRTYRYYPLVTRDEYLRSENRSFLNRVYDGAIGLMCAKFLEEEKLSDQDIEQLQRLLDKQKKGGDEA
ncbi:BlaI/MecI/CopY family transcriptional regulator [Paenibacillus albicereus]|uniref:BlaI/MecI/CopY family transcriptional regulator n=1 Tax=Paenibacillus albicereus TaxID=2726185 RepID=A0A6H2H3P4_9BACL|nr:BlaI/MecI/CopY family transcriptional regulator [Paenibacillus albicereus]QJC54046.1 BlaI/MecI/CopY family transcriptional regulator [Paenibacillus albicereus]